MNTGFTICGRRVGPDENPLVVAEIGINHEGDVGKALRMVKDAASAGCECVKFQCHIVEHEMVPNEVIPANANETIWRMMQRCALSEEDERFLKNEAEKLGMIYLSTPFSREAADRLQRMGVGAFKIGSGECNNYPLIRHVARFGKPIILSTGMNDVDSIHPAVQILRSESVPFAILHCVSIYPTPHDKVQLGALQELKVAFPDAVIGLSDHSLGTYTCIAAVALGARILEKHFTSDKSWCGADVPISLDPSELEDLVVGARAVSAALGGRKEILPEEQPTINFAYASVVSLRTIDEGEVFCEENIWIKRPGTGDFRAAHFEALLGRTAARKIEANTPLFLEDVRSWKEPGD